MHDQLEVLYNAHALEVSSLSLLPLCCCFGLRSDTQRDGLGHATILLNCVRSKFVLVRTKKKSLFGKHASSNSISTFTEDDHRTAKPSFFFFGRTIPEPPSGGQYRRQDELGIPCNAHALELQHWHALLMREHIVEEGEKGDTTEACVRSHFPQDIAAR